MGKSSPKTPAAPDPAKTAAAQTATNKETAYWNAVLNNVNQITPYGKITYTQNTPASGSSSTPTYDMEAYNKALAAYNTSSGPKINPSTGAPYEGQEAGSTKTGTAPTLEQFRKSGSSSNLDSPPSFTSTIELSPEQQQILDSQNRQDIALGGLAEGQIGRIRDSVSSPYSYGGIGNEFSAEDIATQQRNAEAAYMDRLNPQFQRDEEALRTRLINQGIGQGSQAYQREMDTFNQMRNDARSQAVLAGQQYGSTAQQQALQRRNQGIQEYDAQRNAPLNEYIGLTSGTQVTNPQFSSQSYQGAAPVDYAGLVNQNYQNQVAQYNAKQAGSNNIMSSLFGLGGSIAGGFAGSEAGSKAIAGLFKANSDMRLKHGIEYYDEKEGHKRYKFRYNVNPDKEFIGVMAQEVIEKDPLAVEMSEDGYYMVDYGRLGFEMEEV